ncbi:hypothetical protein H642_05660 [Francisella tularensis subsp. tularensis 3571]|nr:hypothetical protein H642_05660 [Francisella tularensis subsp. tularensis 3571]
MLTSATKEVITLFVAATAFSASALTGKTKSALSAKGDFSTLTIASVVHPAFLQPSKAKRKSGLPPDCEIAIASVSLSPIFLPYIVVIDGGSDETLKPS